MILNSNYFLYLLADTDNLSFYYGNNGAISKIDYIFMHKECHQVFFTLMKFPFKAVLCEKWFKEKLLPKETTTKWVKRLSTIY